MTSLAPWNASARPLSAPASRPRSRSSASKVSALNQRRPCWLGKASRDRAHLALRRGGLEGHVDVGPTEVAVELGDLVLEDEAVAEHLPGQLAQEPVVLVGVAAPRTQHEVGLERGVAGEPLLGGRAEERQVAVPQPAELHLDLAGAGQRASRAACRASVARGSAPVATSHRTHRPGRSSTRRATSPAAPISMSSGWAPRASSRSGRPAGASIRSGGIDAPRPPAAPIQGAQGGRPDSASASRRFTSRSVSIGDQYPSCLTASSWCSAIRRSKRLLDQLFAGLDVVEDLGAEHEVAAVDAKPAWTGLRTAHDPVVVPVLDELERIARSPAR